MRPLFFAAPWRRLTLSAPLVIAVATPVPKPGSEDGTIRTRKAAQQARKVLMTSP